MRSLCIARAPIVGTGQLDTPQLGGATEQRPDDDAETGGGIGASGRVGRRGRVRALPSNPDQMLQSVVVPV